MARAADVAGDWVVGMALEQQENVVGMFVVIEKLVKLFTSFLLYLGYYILPAFLPNFFIKHLRYIYSI